MSSLFGPDVWIAFAVTFLAGLATLVGGAIVLFFKQPSFRLLSFGLAFSGGAMVYVSLTEILNKSCTNSSYCFTHFIGDYST